MSISTYVPHMVRLGRLDRTVRVNREFAFADQLISLYQHLYVLHVFSPEDDLVDEEPWFNQLDETRMLLEWLFIVLPELGLDEWEDDGIDRNLRNIRRFVNEDDFTSEWAHVSRTNLQGATLTNLATEGWARRLFHPPYATGFIRLALEVSAMAYAQAEVGSETVDPVTMVKRIHSAPRLDYEREMLVRVVAGAHDLAGEGAHDLAGEETIMRAWRSVHSQGRVPGFARHAIIYRRAAEGIRNIIALFVAEAFDRSRHTATRIADLRSRGRAEREAGGHVEVDEYGGEITVTMSDGTEYHLQGGEAERLLEEVPHWISPEDYILATAQGW